MKRTFTLVAFIALYLFNNVAQAQTVYASIASGAWNSGTVWETYPNYAAAIAASPGGGTASTSTTNPSGTHNVLIRNGHTITMGAANRGCKSIIIQAGGKLWANEAGTSAQRRLQLGAGGTGFTYPLTDTVQIDGEFGGANDAIYFETGVNAQTVKLWGSGNINSWMIRMVGGAGASAGGVLNFTVDANVNLWRNGYAFSAAYNPALTDNYTLTINAGKTVALKTVGGTFHNSQTTATYGQHTYNILGTLDLSAATQTSGTLSANILAPDPASSKITLKIDGGTLKIGGGIKADTTQTAFVSTGVLDFRVVNSGVVDATNTTVINVNKTTDGAGGVRDLIFAADATSSVKVTVGSTEVKFPVGLTGTTTPNTVRLTNTGTADVFTVLLKSTFDNTPPNANVVNRQWTINEAVAGSSVAAVALSWVTADQSAGFNPGSSVFIYRFNGTAWEPTLATVTGSGTAADPYIATASGFTVFSPFIVGNTSTLPVSFLNSRAFTKGNGVQVEWTTAQESNLANFVVEKSPDGKTFAQAARVSTNSTGNYSWLDAAPNSGVNYYRIKSGEVAGSSKFTSIMKVSVGKKAAEMVIASNPIKGNILNLQLSGMEKGVYVLSVYNNAGQKLLQKTITLEGSSLSQGIQLPETGKGLHTVTLQGTSNMLTKKIIVE